MTESTLSKQLRHCAKQVIPHAMIPLMREAADALDAKSALLAEAVTALEHMLFHFGNPQRDEWLNDQAFESAKGADANARSVLTKLKAAQE